MKDNFFWPGFSLLAVALMGTIGALAAASYKHYEWIATAATIAVLGFTAAGLWFLIEVRRIAIIDGQWTQPENDQTAGS